MFLHKLDRTICDAEHRPETAATLPRRGSPFVSRDSFNEQLNALQQLQQWVPIFLQDQELKDEAYRCRSLQRVRRERAPVKARPPAVCCKNCGTAVPSIRPGSSSEVYLAWQARARSSFRTGSSRTPVRTPPAPSRLRSRAPARTVLTDCCSCLHHELLKIR